MEDHVSGGTKFGLKVLAGFIAFVWLTKKFVIKPQATV